MASPEMLQRKSLILSLSKGAPIELQGCKIDVALKPA
jgi:hypothetical protein